MAGPIADLSPNDLFAWVEATQNQDLLRQLQVHVAGRLAFLDHARMLRAATTERGLRSFDAPQPPQHPPVVTPPSPVVTPPSPPDKPPDHK